MNYVERPFIEAGHAPSAVRRDYGYDLTVVTHNRSGDAESGILYLQLKASERLKLASGRSAFKFPISREHFNLWRNERMPVFLVRFCAARRQAYWLYLQPYFQSNPSVFRPGQKSATIYIPAENVFDAKAVRYMVERKREAARDANKAVKLRR